MTTTVLEQPAGVLVEKVRISSIDQMRGIVMVIMALDHVRDFYHLAAFASNPTDLATTTPALFFTRWITHFCAPAFVFLAGTSIFLNSRRRSREQLSIFLLSRGLWLIFLELVVVRFSFFFNFYYDMTIMQVIWAIGASMIAMAAIIRLSDKLILALGVAIVFGHNLADGIQLQPTDNFYAVWAVLKQTGLIRIGTGMNVLAIYPVLPWMGIMMLGYCTGRLYDADFDRGKRKRILFAAGLGATLLFLMLRAGNFYGDPAPWSEQKNLLYTLMSFLNTTKYPVSLLFVLMTLGPVLILLSVMEQREVRLPKPLTVFGRVPLFYFIIHFFIIHFTSLLFFMHKTGKSFSDIDFHFSEGFGGLTSEAGYSLFRVYVAWIALVVLLYPLCRWYDRYKTAHRHWWLSYL